MRLLGDTEWNGLAGLDVTGISAPKARRLLGAGFALAEFLIAPVPARTVIHNSVCSLAALANLMVVVCDGLLDGGASVGDVLPSAELAAGGGCSSPVMVLLREYFLRLEDIRPSEELLRRIRKLVARMFDAEIRTVRREGSLPYCFWLRKSSLPFVLMGLPAWAGCPDASPGRYIRHLLWLYRVGRFFGAIDDAVDFLEDCSAGQPNRWQEWEKVPRASAAACVAGWGTQILEEWDSLVPRTAETTVLRETFLHNIWGWLGPASSQAHAR